MRVLIAATLLMTPLIATAEHERYEASISVNIEDVKPLLLQLETELGVDLPVARMVAICRETPINRASSLARKFRFAGSIIYFIYVVRMDSADTANLHFSADDEQFIEAIKDQLGRFASRHAVSAT